MTGHDQVHEQSEIESTRAQKSRVWRWRNAVSNSDLEATTKHILLELSKNMDRDGGSCWPTITDLCARTSRSRNTVRDHLEVAKQRGWIVIITGKFTGQKWKRHAYAATWPAEATPDDETMKKVGQMVTEGGSIDDGKVGQSLTQDKNLSNNISDNLPNGRAGTREDERLDRRKIETAFLKWLPTWPGYADHSADKARRAWFAMTDMERADCVALTPVYLQGKRRDQLSSPAVFLRKRRFYEVEPPAPEPSPERVHAPYGGPLWMAWWLWQLVQPPNGRIVVTHLDQQQIRDGKIDHDGLMREKRRKHGWPDALAMIETYRARRKLSCPFAMTTISTAFVPVLPDSALFAAWRRLHDRRDWPFPDVVGKVMFFPPIGDLAGNLDEEIEAAIMAFEQQARGIFDGRT